MANENIGTTGAASVASAVSPSKWLKRVTYSDAIETRKLHVLVHGRPKTGKTHFLGTWPKPFVIDADNGLVTLRGSHIPGFVFEKGERAYAVVMDLLRDIKNRRNGFEPGGTFGDCETLGIDTITMLSELIKIDTMLNPVSGKAKDPATEKADFDNWGFTKQRLADIVAAANEITHMHVVVTAWTELIEDDTGAKAAYPKTEGKFKEVMPGRFDEVYYCDVQNGKYIMRTQQYGVYVAGSRLGLPPVLENPSYESLQAALKAGVKG